MKNTLNEVVTTIQNLLGDDFEVRAEEVVKNNNVTMNAIIISSKGASISPVIYIDHMLEQGLPVSEIVAYVLRVFREEHDSHVDVVEYMSNFDNVKAQLNLVLINKTANIDILKEIPYKEFLDLVVVVEVLISSFGGYASAKVNNNLLKLWNITENELFVQAWTNFQKEESYITNICDILNEFGADVPELKFVKPPMYVLSNNNKIKGAVRILDEEQLRGMAEEFNSDVLVIPSSIHECILIPFDAEIELEGMTQMVHDVNGSQVKPEEILSDHVYVYRLKGGWDEYTTE